MRNLIEPGDTITNQKGEEVAITRVTRGTPGVLIEGLLPNRQYFRVYVVPELTPSEPIHPWYNWPKKTFIKLPSGRILSALVLNRYKLDPRTTEVYDSKWEETRELIHQEELKLAQLEGGSKNAKS